MAHPEYPCLGARSVFRRDAATLVVLDDLADTTPGRHPRHPRRGCSRSTPDEVDPEGDLVSFVACFREPVPARRGRVRGAPVGSAAAPARPRRRPRGPTGVAADPDNPHFAFSVAGTAFFVVGLHPNASRVARRAPVPTLVFNLHEQFERMRSDGRYQRMRDTIRRRDTELQGFLNPMVSDHGDDLGGAAVRRSRRAGRLDPTVRGRSRTVVAAEQGPDDATSDTTAPPPRAEGR